MNHVFCLDAYRNYKTFLCRVCGFTWAKRTGWSIKKSPCPGPTQ